MDAEPTAPFVLVRPSGDELPIVVSSPHSAGAYPRLARLRYGVSQAQLQLLDDGPVDRLWRHAPAEGAVLLRAAWSRAWVDLNRDPLELDEAAIEALPEGFPRRRSQRVQAGLGVVPTRLGARPLHRTRLPFADVARRIDEVHRPYHLALAEELARLRRRFGTALLLDCHSMPGGDDLPGPAVDIVLGDRFGRSCDQRLVLAAQAAFQARGLAVARNRPYAGGWITEHHGRPGLGVHALQIEIRRGLFMDEPSHAAHAGLDALARRLEGIVGELGEALLDQGVARAAE